MKQKLILYKKLTIEELQKEIDEGSKFVTFQYCISLLFVITLRRFSPAILIKNDEQFLKFKRKYNLLTYLFGWWGIPWGPFYTVKSLQINNRGGIDVTEDIMLNITKQGLLENEIELKLTKNLFCKPDKWDTKAFKKAFLREFERDYNIKQLVVGLFINAEEDTATIYTIGLRVDKDYIKFIEPLKNALHTQFRKYTHFEFVDLNGKEEILRLLEKQGEFIINRGKEQTYSSYAQ